MRGTTSIQHQDYYGQVYDIADDYALVSQRTGEHVTRDNIMSGAWLSPHGAAVPDDDPQPAEPWSALTDTSGWAARQRARDNQLLADLIASGYVIGPVRGEEVVW